MSHAALLCLTVVLLSSQALESRNYNELEDLIQGFMNGYTGSRVSLPSACLNESSQKRMDEDIVKALSNLLRNDWEGVATASGDFLGELQGLMSDCDLEEVSENFREVMINKGFFWVMTNLGLNFFEIEELTADALTDLMRHKYESAGEKIGKAFALIAPAPSDLQAQKPYQITPADADAFLVGLFEGLEKNPSKPGPCYIAFENVSGYTEDALNDLSRFINGDTLALEQFLIDITEIYYGIADTEKGTCDWSGLIYKLEHTTKNEVLTRCSLHPIECSRDLNDIRNCSADYEKCGKATGALFRVLVDWNLN